MRKLYGKVMRSLDGVRSWNLLWGSIFCISVYVLKFLHNNRGVFKRFVLET